MKNKHPTNHGDTKKTPAELNEFQVIIDQWCDLRQQGKYDKVQRGNNAHNIETTQ